jgi:transcriptional regulator with XRE-family HTH domain
MIERTPHPLRAARLRRGLSQEALAAATTLSESTIKRVEAGARATPHTIKLLSDYFRLKPEALGLLSPMGIQRSSSPKLVPPR